MTGEICACPLYGVCMCVVSIVSVTCLYSVRDCVWSGVCCVRMEHVRV